MKLALAFIAVLFAQSANSQEGGSAGGGFYIEPGLTYEFNSDSSINLPVPPFPSNTSGSIEGIGASVKAGFHASRIIFGGLDLRYSQPKFKDSSNNLEVSSTSTNYGVLLGAQTGLYGIRAWGEYVFGGTLDPKGDNGIDFKFEEANGWRLGAGARVALVSLNLEYQELKYDKTQAVFGGFPVNSDSSELSNKALIASVSFPFDF